MIIEYLNTLLESNDIMCRIGSTWYKLESIGVNDGKEFRNAIFTGTKLYHGKPMLTFVMKTEDNEHINLNINQSYLSYSIEEPMEDKQDG